MRVRRRGARSELSRHSREGLLNWPTKQMWILRYTLPRISWAVHFQVVEMSTWKESVSGKCRACRHLLLERTERPRLEQTAHTSRLCRFLGTLNMGNVLHRRWPTEPRTQARIHRDNFRESSPPDPSNCRQTPAHLHDVAACRPLRIRLSGPSSRPAGGGCNRPSAQRPPAFTQCCGLPPRPDE